MDYEVTTNANEVITRENVQRMGELIAIRATRTLMLHSNWNLQYMYNGLVRDVYYSHSYDTNFSEGYDIAQTAICFLCQFIGHRLGDTYRYNKKGKIVDIKHGCYSEVNRFLARVNMSMSDFSVYDDGREIEKWYIGEDTEAEDDNSTDLETLMSMMNLTSYERETLYCYLDGMPS